MGGWELASWSLDVSPGLAASSLPEPPHPLSFCDSLIGPRTSAAHQRWQTALPRVLPVCSTGLVWVLAPALTD